MKDWQLLKCCSTKAEQAERAGASSGAESHGDEQAWVAPSCQLK